MLGVDFVLKMCKHIHVNLIKEELKMISHKEINDYDSWLDYYADLELDENSNSLSSDDITKLCALKLSEKTDKLNLFDEGILNELLHLLTIKGEDKEKEEEAYEDFMDHIHENLTDIVWPEIRDELSMHIECKLNERRTSYE